LAIVGHRINVASITEAWIETVLTMSLISSLRVASITEAWIETIMRYRRILESARRLHHGGVDRNIGNRNNSRRAIVASITEAWIET